MNLQFERTSKQNSVIDICGTYASLLSISEVGLGSVLHSFNLPFAGHLLSLNQIFLLSRASSSAGKNGSLLLPGSISFIASALKSLSPAGKKLTPMLAITMQGILFNIGIILFGHTAAGRTFGACISSLWGFLQPLLIFYFIFGKALFQTFIKLEEGLRSWVPMDIPSVWYMCIIAVGAKALIAIAISVAAPKLSQSAMHQYTIKLSNTGFKTKQSNPIKSNNTLKNVALLAAKDLCVWPFMACLFLSAISFLWAEGASFSWLIWAVLRPLAIGFIIFFSMRKLPLEKIATWLEGKSFTTLGQAFRIALSKVKQA